MSGSSVMDQQRIIMNFTTPPSQEDIEVIAANVLETLPEELLEFCENMSVQIEEMPDEALEIELDLGDPYELMALYRSGKELAPGVESKVANDDDVLILFRRPLLDMWCESAEDLSQIVRDVMIEELGSHFDFSDEEIDDMSRRHYQGML